MPLQLQCYANARGDEHLEAPVVNGAVALEKDYELGVRDDKRGSIAYTRPIHRRSIRPIDNVHRVEAQTMTNVRN